MKRNLRSLIPKVKRNPDELLRKLAQLLARGQGRKSMGLIKNLRKSGYSGSLDALEFSALTARSRELKRSGLSRESAEMLERAKALMESFDLSNVDAVQLPFLLGALDPAIAFKVYVDNIPDKATSGTAERVLADILVRDGCWSLTDGLDARNPLRKGRPAMEMACRFMDEGDWAKATSSMKGIRKTSPFAPWRLFAKAMEYFEREEKVPLQRVVRQIPEDFILSATVTVLGQFAGNAATAGNSTIHSMLGLQKKGKRFVRTRAGVGDLKRALIRIRKSHSINKADARAFVEAMRKTAKLTAPNNQTWAAKFICEIALRDAADRDLAEDPDDFLEILEDYVRIIPPTLRRVIRKRFLFHQSELNLHDSQLHYVIGYLDDCELDFPSQRDRDILRSVVIEKLSDERFRTLLDMRLFHGIVFGRQLDKLLGRLEYTSTEAPEFSRSTMMEACVRFDPSYRAGYDKILDEPFKYGRSRVKFDEAVYEHTAENFPDEIEPKLNLARSMYSRGAYRMAEGIIKSAELQFPDDSRLLNMKAIGCLVAAERGRSRGNERMSRIDFHRALEMRRPLEEAAVLAKSLALELTFRRVPRERVLADQMDKRPHVFKVRTLCLLLMDVHGRSKRHKDPELEKFLSRAIDREIKHLGNADTNDLINLFSGIDEDLGPAFNFRPTDAASGISDHRPWLLSLLNNAAVTAAYDHLLAARAFEEIEVDIMLRRMESKDSKKDHVLDFYEALVKNLAGKADTGLFQSAMKDSSPREVAIMKAAAGRHSGLARGKLRLALQSFDFTVLT